VLNGRRDDTKLCVVDLQALAFSWCSAKDISSSRVELYGWRYVESLGDRHLIYLPFGSESEGRGMVVVLDGRTGRVLGTRALRSAKGTVTGWPSAAIGRSVRSSDVLVTRNEGWVWAVDLTTLELAWQRGPEALQLVDARAEAEELLGPLPH
jgi:hypothetical protein